MSTAARVRTDPRISRRRRTIERTRRRRLLVSAGAVVMFGATLWLVFWSPLLRVREVVVRGSDHVDAQEVARVAGLDSSDNLLLVSPTSVEDKVGELAWVKSARVNRKLPGTVRVKIVERKPAVVLSLQADRWTLDRFGSVLTQGEAAEDLPVLAGASVTAPRLGTRLQTPEIRSALQAWRSLSNKVRTQVVAVLAPTPERITLSLADGTQVRFGAAENLDAKNEVLAVLLAQLGAENRTVAYIDVRVPSSPALSPATATAGAEPAGPSPSPTS